MRRLKFGLITLVIAAMVLPMLLALPGCIWVHGDRDHHDDHHDGDRHDDHHDERR